MVDLSIQALDSSFFSRDLYVSVRVGDMQKISKASASRTFKFPRSAIGDRRYGKVEFFKRIGGSNVVIDPTILDGSLQEVCVPFEEVKSDIKFRVALCGEDKVTVAGVNKPEHKLELMNKTKKEKVQEAKEYLEKHSLELRLAEAMQAVLRERPDDPGNYIAQWMMTRVDTVTKIPPPAAPTQGAGSSGAPPVTTKPDMAGFPIDEIRKQTTKCLMQASVDGTLSKALLQARGMDSAAERGSGKAFMQLPSVGTWIQYRKGCAKAVVEPQNQALNMKELTSMTAGMLLKAHNDGTLPGIIKQVRATEQNSSGEAFVKMPSVGTWIQHRAHSGGTLEDKEGRIDELRKVTSQTLLQASADGTLEQILSSFQPRKKRYIMSTSALMGSFAYRSGMKLNYRVI